MDSSLPLRVAKAGSLVPNRQAVFQESHLQTPKNPYYRHTNQALEPCWETTGELVSAILDDTSTMEQQVFLGSPNLFTAAVAIGKPTEKTFAHIPHIVEPCKGRSGGNAISRANMSAFEANRSQSESTPGLSSRIRPTTTLQPKITSRRRRDTIRHGRPSPGSKAILPQNPAYRPAGEDLDRTELAQTVLFPPPTIPRQVLKNLQGKNRKIRETESGDEVPVAPCNLKRQSASILALTNVTKLAPQDVTALCRSKTTREPRKRTLTKQQNVLKKITSALTDRLHLTTHKATDVEPHEADEERGRGFYDYDINRFVKDVVEDIPTQKRRLPSRLAEIYERDESKKCAQHMYTGSYEGFPDRKRSRSWTSKESCDDPFAEPECTKRCTTDFVHRLRATTPSKDDSDPNPVPVSASPFTMEMLLRGSINSLLPFPPVGASTPRITVNRRSSFGVDEGCRQWRFTKRMSLGTVALSPESDAIVVGEPHQSCDEDCDNGIAVAGHHLAPPFGYTYQPVLDVPNRKKHPSPNKADLELLESRLRQTWPETLSQATEKAKKHPSPLKVDMQALGEEFRKAYPDLLGGNTPKRSKKCDDSVCALRSEDEPDELALSLATSTPEKKRVTRHRKVSSVSCLSQAAALEAKSKRMTIAMPEYGDNLSSAPHMQLARPAYHQA